MTSTKAAKCLCNAGNPGAEQGNRTLRKPEQHPWSSCHHCRTEDISDIPTTIQDHNIPKLKVLATLQSQLLLGLARSALKTQDNLLGGLGLLVENGLGLTTVTTLLPVVTTLTLGVQGGLL